MSTINVDVENFYKSVPSTTIQPTLIAAESTSSKEDVEAIVRKLFLGNTEMMKFYSMFKHGASITNNKSNSLNHFNFLINAWFITMKATYPDSEEQLSKIQKSIDSIQNELDTLLQRDKVSNTIFITALAGLLVSII